jgi:hypothetical protein
MALAAGFLGFSDRLLTSLTIKKRDGEFPHPTFGIASSATQASYLVCPSDISFITSSTLNLAGFWRIGNSANVCKNLPTKA